MPQEQSLRKVLQAGSGDLLQAIHSTARGIPGRFDDLAQDLVALHNEGVIDAVAALSKLRNAGEGHHEFFLIRHVFEKALPQLRAPVEQVMYCVLSLCREAGRDMAAGTILNAFTAFCLQDSARAHEAMRLILADPDGLADMIAATVAAQSTVSDDYDLAAVLELARHPEIEVRRRAIFAIGRICVPTDSALPLAMLAALEKAQAVEADDHVLAAVVEASFACLLRDQKLHLRAVALIDDTLNKGEAASLHAAAALLWFRAAELPSQLRSILLSHLLRVQPEHTSTLDQLDHGIASLLSQANPSEGLQFLETLLITHDGSMHIESLDSTMSQIRQSPSLLATVVTRWLWSGRQVLCEAINQVVSTHHGTVLQIEIDASEIPSMDTASLVFIARKAIGYFFISHLTATSIVTSLMQLATDEEALDALGAHLVDPLLLNYPGSTRDYLEANAARASAPVKQAIEKALVSNAEYLSNLSQIPALAALHPGQSQREAHRRHMDESMSTAMSTANRSSALLNLFPRSTLLYGHKAISYIHTGEAKPHRVEMPLTNHGVSIELPRMNNLAPYDLDYMLRVFRVERLVS